MLRIIKQLPFFDTVSRLLTNYNVPYLNWNLQKDICEGVCIDFKFQHGTDEYLWNDPRDGISPLSPNVTDTSPRQRAGIIIYNYCRIIYTKFIVIAHTLP